MKSRHLDECRSAYAKCFKFHNENIAILNWYVSRVIQSMRLNNFNSLLSLGIGHQVVSGNIINCLGKQLERYVIIEGSSKIIQDLKKSCTLPEQVTIIESLFEEYTPGCKFNAIEMGFVLEHVDDPLYIVKKYAKFLKNNGRIFIAVPNARSLHRLIGKSSGLLKDVYKLSKQDLQLGHQRYFDCDSLLRLIKKAGLKPVRIEGLYLKPFSTSQLESLRLSDKVKQALFKIGAMYPQISNAIYAEVRK